MPKRRKNSDPSSESISRLKSILKDGISSGMFSARHKSDVLVRAAYLRGISDAIDIIQQQVDKSSVEHLPQK